MKFQYKGFEYSYRILLTDILEIELILTLTNIENPFFIQFPDKINDMYVRDIAMSLFYNTYFKLYNLKYIIFPSQMYSFPSHIFDKTLFNKLKYVKLNNIWVKYTDIDKWKLL